MDEESDSTAKAKRSLEASEGGLGGGVGNVWYRGIEGRLRDAMLGIGAPAWNEPEDLADRDRVVTTPGPGRVFAGRVMMAPADNLGALFLSSFFVLSFDRNMRPWVAFYSSSFARLLRVMVRQLVCLGVVQTAGV